MAPTDTDRVNVHIHSLKSNIEINYLRRRDGQETNHQIYFKILDMIFLANNYHLVKNKIIIFLNENLNNSYIFIQSSPS